MTSPAAAPAIYVPFPAFSDWIPSAFDTEQFDRYGAILAQIKAAAAPERLEIAMSTAMRNAAVDTNAIEGLYETDRGFTRTVATQAASWQIVMDARGPHVRPAFYDALNGYQYVLDAATKSVLITEVWIRELHAILCASQKTYKVYTEHGPQERPLVAGSYKTMPNSPTLMDGRMHAYAPVADTSAEMNRFVQELRTVDFLEAHPVLQAAYAHYAYVCVHPFADGNGRVARALASAYLYRTPGVPLVIFSDQRNDYFDALELADDGDSTAFIQFIGARTIDSVGMMRVILEQKAPPIHQSLLNINTIFNVGVQVEELHAAAIRLKNLAYAELKKQCNALTLPPQLDLAPNPNEVEPASPPTGYGSIGKSGSFFVAVSSSWPVRLRVLHSMTVFTRSGTEAGSDLLVASRSGSLLDVSLSEIDPIETEALRIKVASWIEGVLGEVFAEVEVRAAAGRP